MKIVTFLILLFSFFLFSCKESKNDYVLRWGKEVKEKIIKESSVPADSTNYDSSNKGVIIITAFKKGNILRQTRINPATKDTFASGFYSSDQKFELIRELCPLLKNESVEAIVYNDTLIGPHYFMDCSGQVNDITFHYKGREIKPDNDSNMKKLVETLKEIKY